MRVFTFILVHLLVMGCVTAEPKKDPTLPLDREMVLKKMDELAKLKRPIPQLLLDELTVESVEATVGEKFDAHVAGDVFNLFHSLYLQLAENGILTGALNTEKRILFIKYGDEVVSVESRPRFVNESDLPGNDEKTLLGFRRYPLESYRYLLDRKTGELLDAEVIVN